MLRLGHVDTEEQLGEVRRLFEEYAAFLGFDLSFQGFDRELLELPGDYSPPCGRLLLARWGDQTAGCVALRKLGDGCEMKRLWVRPEFRGRRVGLALGKAIIDEARDIGYPYMRLDTVPALKEATSLYRSLGFREIEPYRFNPIEGAIYMELDLRGQEEQQPSVPRQSPRPPGLGLSRTRRHHSTSPGEKK